MDIPFPTHARALTERWLTEALRRSGALIDGRVVQLALRPLRGAGQTSETTKIELTYDNAEPAAPQRLVAKFASPSAATRQVFHDLDMYNGEVRFYAELARDAGIRVPHAYVAEIDPQTGHFVILMEDMEELGELPDADAALPYIERALDHLAGFHAKWWNNPRLPTLRWLPQADDHARYAQLGALLADDLPTVERRYGDNFNGYLRDAARRLDARWNDFWPVRPEQQVTLIHGDCTPSQMMFGRGDSTFFALFDWGTVNANVAGADVARLFLSALDAQTLASHQQRLTERYHAALQAHGITYSLEQLCFDIRNRMLISVCILITALAHTDIAHLEQRAADHGVDWTTHTFRDLSEKIERNRVIETLG